MRLGGDQLHQHRACSVMFGIIRKVCLPSGPEKRLCQQGVCAFGLAQLIQNADRWNRCL